MARLTFSDRALDDLERLSSFLAERDRKVAIETVELITEAVGVLARHPLIGRKVEEGLRELVISRGASGYVMLYRFTQTQDVVRILAIRHQRELGYA